MPAITSRLFAYTHFKTVFTLTQKIKEAILLVNKEN